MQLAHGIRAALRRAKIRGRVGPSSRKAGPNQQDCIGRNRPLFALGALQVVGGHKIVAIFVSLRRHIDDNGRSEEPFQRDLFHRLGTLGKMNGRIEMCSPVLGRGEIVSRVVVALRGHAIRRFLQPEGLRGGPEDCRLVVRMR